MSTSLSAHLVAHEQLLPSLTNPRKRFDESRLQELADSMKPPIGILEPLVVRPLPPADGRAKHLDLSRGPFYEIVAGERRWRAAKIAKLPQLPVVVRDIPDEQVITLQLVENKNREDIHPLEEAEAMDRLLKINKTVTPKSLAATIGMSERYVQNRLHYLRLVPEVKEAFRKEEITAGHVDLIMRLPDADQTLVYEKGCFEERLNYDDSDDRKGTRVRELRSVRDLGEWINHNVRLQVAAKAPEMDFLPDVAEALAAASVESAPTLVQLADSYFVDDKVKPKPLTRHAWSPVKKGQKCDHQTRGVIVLGDKRGQVLTVCTGVGKCKVHFPHTIRQPEATPPKGFKGNDINGAAAAAARKSQQDAKRREQQQREHRARWAKVLDAAYKQAKQAPPARFKPTPPIVQLLVDGLREKTVRDAVLGILDDDTFINSPRDVPEAVKRFKVLGIDLVAIDKQLERERLAIAAEAKLQGGRQVQRMRGVKPAPKRKAGAKK
jgi:ParB/RepB/Spo0J family partition protein